MQRKRLASVTSGRLVSYSLKFSIVGLPEIISNRGRHWASRYKQKKLWHKLVAQAVGTNKPSAPLKIAQAEFVRASSVAPDYDNLVISFKSTLDGLKLAGVIEDDKLINLPEPKYAWEYAPRGAGHIRVKIEEVTA